MTTALISAILQILAFTLIPFLVHVISNKSVKGFFNYIGLKKSTLKANSWAVVACLLFAGPMLILTLTNADFKEIMLDPQSITGEFRAMGLSPKSIFLIIIIAVAGRTRLINMPDDTPLGSCAHTV